MKVLISGFEPFGGESINPSWETVRALEAPEGVRLERLLLPVSFREAPRELLKAAESFRPEAILCVGQAGGRSGISLERIAVNLADARLPDNDGFQPQDLPLEPEGKAAFFSTLPLRRLEERLKAAEIPVQISNTAGLYVCNAVFYEAARWALEQADRHSPAPPVGFIHVPYLPEQAEGKGAPFLTLEEDILALKIILGEICGPAPIRSVSHNPVFPADT